MFELIEYMQKIDNFNKFVQNNAKKINELKKYNISDVKAYLKFLELEIFKYNRKIDYQIKDIEIIFDNFGNPYIYVNFNPYGYMVVSLINNESVIIDPLNKNKDSNSSDFHKKYFLDLESLRIQPKNNSSQIRSYQENFVLKNFKGKYYEISDNLNNKKLIEEKQNLKFSLKKSISYRNSSEAHKINTNVEMIHAEKEVPYSWWFKLAINNKNFGYQDYSTINARWEKEKEEAKLRGDEGEAKFIQDKIDKYKCSDTEQGLCHYVALGMLLLYAEFFQNYGVFSDDQVKKYFVDYQDSSDYSTFKKYGYPYSPAISDEFVTDLWTKHGWGAIVTTSSYLKNVAYDFLKKPDLPNFWPVYVYRRSAGWIKPWKWIRDGYPCLIFGTYMPDPMGRGKVGHAIVAYGMYDNGNKLLCHYGWGGYSQVIVSSSLSGQLFLLGMKPNGKVYKTRKHFIKNGIKYSGTDFK
ncbi:hypothetical protein IEN87_03050 [Mycoplasma hominis]|uniref:putative cysteine peptidase n=1 Tax=Metamycoplasma hominis TaxID=2098 RepID=UPI001747A612|nr:hypothetical protein [Metamycoplasma hominis]MBD3899173.1 hypothetical protein [Metamycoplasma hominis]